jgi:hypothetical protein
VNGLPWIVIVPLGGPPLSACLWQAGWRRWHWKNVRVSFFTDWLATAVGFIIFGVVQGPWLVAACAGASFAIALVIRWWWRRKDRKRAAKALGAKSRALRDALVRKAREAARPRRVLQPVPGGAR